MHKAGSSSEGEECGDSLYALPTMLPQPSLSYTDATSQSSWSRLCR